MQEGSQEITNLPARCLYPFYVIQVKDFLKFRGAPLPHQELLRRNLLRPWREGNKEQRHMFTSFVSHQWCGRNAPDPRGLQLDALRHLLMNGFKVSDCYANFMDGTESVSEAERKQVVEGWLWYDFFGIPQHGLGYAQTCDIEFRAAVQSIVGYVQHSDIFIALTPAIPHEDGGRLNFGSWHTRGWCAAELSFWALRMPFRRQRIVRVHSSTKATCQRASSWLQASVYTGDFTVEDDRIVVCELLRSILRECAADLAVMASQRGSEAKMVDAGLLLGTAEQRLCGPPPSTQEFGTMSLSSNLPRAVHLQYSEWLEIVDWNKLVGFGWTPAHFHAHRGDRSRLREYLGVHGTHMLGTKVKYVSFWADYFKGVTPLLMAVAAPTGDPVGCIKELLAQRADVEDAALICAIANPKGKIVSELLNARADLHYRVPFFGDTALSCASRFGNDVVARELIEHKADVNSRNSSGFTCLHLAADLENNLDNPAIVHMLIQARADVDAKKTKPSSCFGRLFESVQRARHVGGSRSELVQHVSLVGSEGATALHLAAFAGNWRVCSALLEHGAFSEARTRAGHTPANVARLCGHDESFQNAVEDAINIML
eukprot:TRINITY_DN10380_c0_g2_i2.p1 TRINITY_DN10380_c0_g2~~TRINITY_DN10380_c0_g2_i2.p1  ORF type:complete len:600 (+),score=43.38 TRINITY_DN10380_c0_g2_i2:62-1861(+)